MEDQGSTQHQQAVSGGLSSGTGVNLTKRCVIADAFAGCGGLSLGLMQAGLSGRFAIEHDKFAFATLRENLMAQGAQYRFSWPRWLSKDPISIIDLIDDYQAELVMC